MSGYDRGKLEEAAKLASRDSATPISCTGSASLGAIVAARFQLANGLKILFVSDPRAPVFAYQTWFRVGSKDESPEQTGYAHLLEHLMFKGTKKYAAGTLDREAELRGAQTNAATWVDWTFYQQALAARGDNLETMVDFESDRMTQLVIDPESFASELEVVKNERRMSVEDSVNGRLSEALFSLAFTQHPYRWLTIGLMEHLERADPAALERFYRTYYAPNNATVVVVGALELVPTLILLAKHYGPLAPETVSRPPRPREPRQREPRLVCVKQPAVAPQLAVGYHAPAELDPDFLAARVLGEVIMQGDNARLYRRLVSEEKIATEVEGSVLPFADPGLYELSVTGRAACEPEQMISVLQDELDKLPDSLSEDEIEKAKNGLELEFFESWQTAWGIAERLGHFETNYGDFALAFDFVERLARTDRSEVVRVARELFRADNRSVALSYRQEESGDV